MPTPHVEFRSRNEAGEDVHEYSLDGKDIPSVSEILTGTGISNYDDVPEEHVRNARERGLTIDQVCQWYDEDNYSVGDVMLWQEDRLNSFLPDDVLSDLMAWVQFRKDYNFKPTLVAKPISHMIAGMPYGMTPDRVGTWKIGPKLVVLDLKRTAALMLSHKVQLAGYKMPFIDNGVEPDCYIFQFKGNGKYQLHGPINDKKYERAFLSALSLTHLKRQER